MPRSIIASQPLITSTAGILKSLAIRRGYASARGPTLT